uniref:Reverse transcriptase RNase H-like domain-containing protein n=1 Tax=Romanomermis culicivorax TaxID=13658 RepID=A0A915IWZ1_ROMCU
MYGYYIYGQKVIIRTDHKLLEWLKDEKHQNLHLQCFTINLQDYNYKVEYFKGKDNAWANFSSGKDEPEKWPALSTKELAIKIFCPQFCSTNRISEAEPTATNISPVLPMATLEQPPVEAITIAMQEEIPTAQAADPTISKIIEALQTANAA